MAIIHNKIVLLSVNLFSIIFVSSMAAYPSYSQVDAESYEAPNVAAQFEKLPQHGDPLAVHVGVGLRDYGEVFPCKHYQGVARGLSNEGTPYFFFTRSRNKTWSCLLDDCDPGELLIVEMGSRAKDGERLRSNRLQSDKSVDHTAPPGNDIGVKAIYFDGASTDGQEQGHDIWPFYWHPGGVQLLEDVLVVPLECTTENLGMCFLTNPSGCKGNYTGVALIDVSDPEEPDLLLHQSLDDKFPDGLGVVGVTKDPASGKYLFVFTWGDSRILKFGWSDTEDLRTTQEITIAGYEWYNENPTSTHQWQTLNFVSDTNGDLYLLGADNSTSGHLEGTDILTLLKVDLDKLNDVQVQDAIKWVDSRHLIMAYHGRPNVADLGDLDAASGFYVSPTGQLTLYASHFRDSGADGHRIIEMGEFRNMEVSHTGTCGLQLPLGLGNPKEINEGDQLELSFDIYYIEPWVHMFAETHFRNRSLMMDAADQNDDDQWRDFPKVGGRFWPSCFSGLIKSGFNDTLQSFKFCGSPGSSLQLYDDDGFKVGNSSYPSVEGTGTVISREDVRVHGSGKNAFACEATSAFITWSPPPTYDLDVDWGEGESEQFSNLWGNISFELHHHYLDDDPTGTQNDLYTITIADNGGGPSTISTAVTVHNVPPSPRIESITDTTTGLEIGQGLDLPVALVGLEMYTVGSFTDPGIYDTHIAETDWGDGTVNNLRDVVDTVTDEHIYMAPGVFDIILSVTDDDLGEGTANREVKVVSAQDAFDIVINLLRPHADNRNIATAITKLEGGAGGRASNGAIDLLEKDNLNAALEEVKKAMRYLTAAENADPTLDLGFAKPLLALSAKSEASELIANVASKPATGDKLAKANTLLMQGDALAKTHNYSASVESYQRAARAVYGLRK